MFDTMFYIFLGLYFMYYLLISERKGLNFALKSNFIASFLAPIVSYFILFNLISDSIDINTRLIIIFILTGIIIFGVGVLTTMKAFIDNPDCENSSIRYRLSLKHAGKLLLVCMLTFIAVILSPILQAPFTNILRNYQTENPQKFIYMIIGFYMAFVSLSGTTISYMAAYKESCVPSDRDLKLIYEENTQGPAKSDSCTKLLKEECATMGEDACLSSSDKCDWVAGTTFWRKCVDKSKTN